MSSQINLTNGHAVTSAIERFADIAGATRNVGEVPAAEVASASAAAAVCVAADENPVSMSEAVNISLTANAVHIEPVATVALNPHRQ